MRRVSAIAVTVLLLCSLAGCYKGEVKEKDSDRNGYPALLIDDGTRERWVTVSPAVFERCAIGEWYEDELCRASQLPRMEEVPDPDSPNDPYRDPDVDKRDRNVKEVCVSATSVPAVKFTVAWAIAWDAGGPETSVWSRYGPRCRRTTGGGTAFIVVEHARGDGRQADVWCRVFIYDRGATTVLDEGEATGHHDCEARARIP